MRSARSKPETPSSSRPNSTLARTVRQGKSANSWNTVAAIGRPARGSPSK